MLYTAAPVSVASTCPQVSSGETSAPYVIESPRRTTSARSSATGLRKPRESCSGKAGLPRLFNSGSPTSLRCEEVSGGASRLATRRPISPAASPNTTDTSTTAALTPAQRQPRAGGHPASRGSVTGATGAMVAGVRTVRGIDTPATRLPPSSPHDRRGRERDAAACGGAVIFRLPRVVAAGPHDRPVAARDPPRLRRAQMPPPVAGTARTEEAPAAPVALEEAVPRFQPHE